MGGHRAVVKPPLPAPAVLSPDAPGAADFDPFAWFAFTTRLIVWRGPAPFLFAPMPGDRAAAIRAAARLASYGWGVIPVEARIGTIVFTTSLIPRDGSFLLPIKQAVQHSAKVSANDAVMIAIRVAPR